jgi:glucuronosyltransferase
MQVIQLCILLTCLLTLIPPTVNGARILVLLGFSGKSHNHGIGEVTSELARKGHEITMVSPFAMKDPPGKYQVIDMPITRKLLESFDLMGMKNQSMFQKFKFFWSMCADNCPNMLKLPEIRDLLKKKFDLVILSMFFNDCFLPFAYHNKAPLILFSPAGLLSWVGSNLGNPEPTSYVPSVLLPFSHDMSFVQRFINTVTYYTLDIMRRVILLPVANEAAREFFGPDTPSIIELERNASLVLLNTHVSMNYPRPLQPNFIEVGGMHIKPNTEPLPKVSMELEAFQSKQT